MAQSIESAANLLSFYPFPQSLQTLASFEIATVLLRHKLRCKDGTQNTSSDTWMSGIRQCLRLPKAVGDKIHESVERLNKEILFWIKQYRKDCLILITYSDRDLQKLFVDLVVIGNCDKTIRKFLDSDKLTVLEKYKIACYHCFEDDIKKLWNSVSDTHWVYKNECGYLKDVIYYWNCHMTNVPADELFRHYRRDFCLESSFLDWYNLNWPATKYFWSKLNSKERLSAVIDVVFMKDCTGEKLVEFLPQVNEAELVRVLKWETTAALIFSHLGTKVEYFESVLQVWTYYCSFASEEMVWRILKDMPYNLPVNTSFTWSERFHQSWVLGQLWHRTSSKVKEYVNREERVESFFYYMQPNSLADAKFKLKQFNISIRYRDITFWLEILKGVDSTRRNEIWRKNWYKMFVRTDRQGIDRFMKLCFQNDQDIEEFKQTEMAAEPFQYEELEDLSV